MRNCHRRLGCGENDDEIRQTLRDLLTAGVEIVTLGQYLQPTKKHMKVSEFVTPEKYDLWTVEAEAMGFKLAPSGPMGRSSYKAGVSLSLSLALPSSSMFALN